MSEVGEVGAVGDGGRDVDTTLAQTGARFGGVSASVWADITTAKPEHHQPAIYGLAVGGTDLAAR